MEASQMPMAYINKIDKLADAVPLRTPYSILISPSSICDFKCIYCTLHDHKHLADAKDYTHSMLMSLKSFNILSDQISEFNEPLRQVLFAGRGEPLTNEHLPEMIKIIKNRNLAINTRVLTNANKLTNEKSNQLITAGLDCIAISLQGLSSEKYKKICGVAIDFNKFVEQIKYYYKNRQNCKVYIKIIDVALDEGEESKFFEIFSDMCDYIYVEKYHGEHSRNDEKTKNKYGLNLDSMNICPSPFYKFMVEHNGDVIPCCQLQPNEITKAVMGNIHHVTLKQLWDSRFKTLQLSLLHNELSPPPPIYLYQLQTLYS